MKIMKIMDYASVAPTLIDNDQAKAVAARVVIGKEDGADHFCMRIFEIMPGGYSPKHAHAWEHEIFIHAGVGEAYGNGQWRPVKPGTVLFVPSGEEHQIRNPGRERLSLPASSLPVFRSCERGVKNEDAPKFFNFRASFFIRTCAYAAVYFL